MADQEQLRFRLKVPAWEFPAIARAMDRLNATAWQGREPLSCKIVDVREASRDGESAIGAPAPVGHPQSTILLITVGYRPAGWISDSRETGDVVQRHNGWRLEIVTPGETPNDESLHTLHDIYFPVDFHDFDFGQRV
jgi:hypothetical protein